MKSEKDVGHDEAVASLMAKMTEGATKEQVEFMIEYLRGVLANPLAGMTREKTDAES